MRGRNTRGVTHGSLGHDVATPHRFPPPSSQSSSCDLLGKVPAPPTTPLPPPETFPTLAGAFQKQEMSWGFGREEKGPSNLLCWRDSTVPLALPLCVCCWAQGQGLREHQPGVSTSGQPQIWLQTWQKYKSIRPAQVSLLPSQQSHSGQVFPSLSTTTGARSEIYFQFTRRI